MAGEWSVERRWPSDPRCPPRGEPPKPPGPRTCNRHYDCDYADMKAKARGSYYGADHCHDDCCEDCFGC